MDIFIILLSLLSSEAVKARHVPHHHYSTFTYPPKTTERYATPLNSPLTFATPFAEPFSKASSLLDPDMTYTTYSLNPDATSTQDGPYGQSAYASLWANASITYSDHPPFTTTVSPTPVPSSELVFPPALPVIPVGRPHPSKQSLPKNFIWGVSSSAWQIEGGLKLEGRGPSVLDMTGALPSTDNSSNVNAMFYYMYKQDIERLAAIGIPYFSFSIPWTRIVPFAVAGSPVNKQALDHYEDLIDTAIAHGITPIVTILHFDLPMSVLYTNDDFSEHFLYYAKQLMARFGDRVPYWVTVNEPNMQPVDNGLTNILTAHAKVYDWYKNELKGTGKVTMKFANNLAVPLDPSNSADVTAARRYQEFDLGVMNNPLFLGKQIPKSVLNTPSIKIDPLTKEQLERVGGKIDFFSFDPYTAQYVTPPPEGIDACAANSSNPLWPKCVETTFVGKDGWLMGDSSTAGFNTLAPQYVRSQLGYLWNTFRPKGILVAEYGFPSAGDTVRSLDQQRYDLERTLYYQAFLIETLKAIHEDGVNVIGALAWSIMDTNEFGSFDSRFGLQTVNHTTFKRMYKRSLFDYVDFFHRHVGRS
ncbi:beta-glucosidase [Aspergillus sclerotialis]|uniref:Beta-glucosidase n=1 Tax=Aspergillus sclerotialis TaxID=2070753 RepID=A0A3A2ZV42_9EURO|nr:beta-glucosidase [Aspergillus sclerotialis]